jgi:hypothetical protein
MTLRLLRSELLKLRTTRTFAALVAASLALGLLLAGLTASLTDDPVREEVRDLLLSDTSGLFILVLGIVGAAGEWRHRTIAGTLLAAPDRRALLLAKALAYAAAGVSLSLLVTLAVAALGTAILESRDELTPTAGQLFDVLWRNLAIAACSGAIGVGIGTLVPNQPAAIVTVLVILFVVEPTLGALAPEVAQFGPFIGAGSGVSGSDAIGEEVLPAGLALLVLLGWAAGLCAAAAEALVRRDVT